VKPKRQQRLDGTGWFQFTFKIILSSKYYLKLFQMQVNFIHVMICHPFYKLHFSASIFYSAKALKIFSYN